MMPMDQQQVEPVEMPLLLDKEPVILFGLTGRQVLVLICGIAVGFTTWETSMTFHSIAGAILLVCLCVVPASLVAFLKVGGKPLEKWLFILLAWLFIPDHLNFRSLARLFIRVKSLRGGIVTLHGEGQRLDYQVIMRIETHSTDLLSGVERSIMINTFGRVLNGLSYPVTIHIRSLPDNPMALAATIIDEQLARPLRRLHAHYLSFLSQVVQAKQPVCVSYYMVIPAGASEEKDEGRRFVQAKGQLANRVQDISRELARGGLSCRPLSAAELFTFYREPFVTQQSTRALVTDDVLDVQLPPLTMSLEASSFSLHEPGGTLYLSCFELTSFPRMVYPGWLARVIVELHEPYIDMSISIEPHESDQVAMKLKRKAVMLGGALLAEKQQHGGDEGGNTLTRYALKDVERVREQLLQRETHLYSVALVFLVRARSRDELRKREERLQLTLRSIDFSIRKLRFQQHLGYVSSLGYNQNLLSTHLLPTNAVASFFPFTHVSTMEERGVFLGTTKQGNLVSFDPYTADRLNANLAVLGVPGSGKSFFLKVLLSRIAAYIAISIIDVEDEYTRLIQALGGQRIELTADSFHINPLELQAQGQTFREKIAMLLGFFALLIGEGGDLTRHESAVIEHCLLQVYATSGITADPITHTRPAPGMQDVAHALKRETSGSELALRLASFLHLFPRTSHLQNGQHTVYNLKRLPETLRPAATYLLTERLWSELQAGRQDNPGGTPARRHIIVIDEAWFLTKYEAGATLLNDFARRVRKYHGGLWLGTQQLTDILSSEQGKNLLALCETKMLFRQDISSIDIMRSALHLSAAQSQYVQTARQGEALMLSSKDTLALEIVASEQETAIAITTQHV